MSSLSQFGVTTSQKKLKLHKKVNLDEAIWNLV